jgi:hypothetical protein
LEWLSLGEARINDLAPLVGLTNLTDLDVLGTQVTKEQIEALQKALPTCKIDHDPFP